MNFFVTKILLLMKRLIVFCFWMLTVLAGALAQSQSFWERIKSPDGGDIRITLALDGTLYGQPIYRTLPIYRSSDNGENWEQVPLGIPPSLDSSYLSVGPSGNFYWLKSVTYLRWQLFVSTNEGADWQMVKDSLPRMEITETASGALLTFIKGVIWRSGDGGHTWSIASPVLASNYPDLYFSQMPNGDLLFYRQRSPDQFGAYISSDDGQSWALLSPQFPRYVYVAPSGTILFVGLGSEIHRSTDNGDTWTVTSLPVGTGPQTSFCALPSGRLLGTAANQGFVIFSDDDGATWQTLPSDHSISAFPLTTALPNGVVLGMCYGALHRSEDEGGTWDFSAQGYDRGGTRVVGFA